MHYTQYSIQLKIDTLMKTFLMKLPLLQLLCGIPFQKRSLLAQ